MLDIWQPTAGSSHIISGMMFFSLVILVALPLLVALFLIKTWAMSTQGIDLETQSMEWSALSRLSSRQKLTLVLLAAPAAILLLFGLLYMTASAVTMLVGASGPGQ